MSIVEYILTDSFYKATNCQWSSDSKQMLISYELIQADCEGAHFRIYTEAQLLISARIFLTPGVMLVKFWSWFQCPLLIKKRNS